MEIVIVGSGMAGVSLAEELKKLVPTWRIAIVTQETHGYYSRPLLSHGFSREDIEQKIVLRSFDALRSMGIEIHAGVEVSAIDRSVKRIALKGTAPAELGYERLVLAQGSDALIPPPFRPYRDLYYVLNSLDDLLALRRRRGELIDCGQRPRWAVVGGGLIGCELSSDLAKAGDDVTLFHALPRLMERQLVEEDSQALARLLQESSVMLRLDCAVTGFTREYGQFTVLTAGGSAGSFDGVVVSCGFRPRIDLAKAAGLPTGRGILVDSCLTTADPDIFAIGDVAECADGRLYAYVLPIRGQALWLARRLAGAEERPWEPPFFKPKAKVHGFTASHPYLF